MTKPNAERCELCGELVADGQEYGEFYNPTFPTIESVIAHAECALQRGLELA